MTESNRSNINNNTARYKLNSQAGTGSTTNRGAAKSSESSDSDEENKRSHNHRIEEDTDHMCLICAENMTIASLSPCNHKVCHLCSFRNVALYQKNQCLICRTETPKLIYTENLGIERFDDIKEADLIPSFKNDYGVRYTSQYAKDETLRLLEFRCPVKSCNMQGMDMNNFKELNNHVKDVHGKFYCELCAKFKKAFIVELKLYNRKQLHHHQARGDSAGFKGHPECKFCTGKRFYSDDELLVHMRDSHERCHVCQKIDPSNPQYFRNYEHLAQHFKSAHYVCNVQSCLDQKFVVFGDEFELQTHLAKEHSNIYGNNIFATNSFNSQLYTVSSSNRNKKVTQKDTNSSDSLELKRKRLDERAKHYLNYSNDKFKEFKQVNSDYTDENISAHEVNQKYHEIFKESRDVDYDLLIYELARLFPQGSDRRKDLEIINKPQLEERDREEKFPLLPGMNRTITSSIWDSKTPTSKTKLKKKANNSSLFPELPGTSSNQSWITSNSSSPSSSNLSSRSSSKSSLSNLKTRGLSSNSTPINAYSIPGYNPISNNNGKSKTKNPWNSPKAVGGITTTTTTTTTTSGTINSMASSLSTGTSTASALKKKPTVTIVKRVATKPLDDNMFPTLPSATKKKIIPRVRPVDTSGGVWGDVGLNTPTYASPSGSGSDSGGFGLENLTLKGVKKGKKGKKVVYQLGFD